MWNSSTELKKVLDAVRGRGFRQIVAVIGGDCLAEKASFLEGLLPETDALLIGGGLANTFLTARGGRVGSSPVEEDQLPAARAILRQAESLNTGIFLPIDTLAANELTPAVKPSLEGAMALFGDKIAGDIGPRTVQLFENRIRMADALIWSGAMGAYRIPAFSEGTRRILTAVRGAGVPLICCGEDCEELLRFYSLS